MRLLVTCIAAIVALSAAGASAAKPSGAPTQFREGLGPLVGIGAQPCSYWTQHRQAKDQEATAAAEWLWGHLSGYDQFRVSTNKHLWFEYDIAPVLDFVDRKCAEAPSSSLAIALNGFMFVQEAGAARRTIHR